MGVWTMERGKICVKSNENIKSVNFYTFFYNICTRVWKKSSNFAA